MMNNVPIVPEPVVVCADGGPGPKEGGSGLRELLEMQSLAAAMGKPYEIVAIVSRYPNGGVKDIAEEFGVPFCHWQAPANDNWRAESLYELVGQKVPEFAGQRLPVMLSGFLKLIKGFRFGESINIHPGWTILVDGELLFAGPGMHGDKVHSASLSAWRRRIIDRAAVTIHIANDQYDDGAVVACFTVLIEDGDDVRSLQRRVNQMEHKMQWIVMAVWLHGGIKIDEKTGTVISSPFEIATEAKRAA